jgi:hypothetical protein
MSSRLIASSLLLAYGLSFYPMEKDRELERMAQQSRALPAKPEAVRPMLLPAAAMTRPLLAQRR